LNNKIKKNTGILIIGFLILIFIYNQNLFRKFYNVFNLDFETRIAESSGYCRDDSVGYLRYLKKKYNFNFNPLVVNYEDKVPDSNWAVYDTRFKNDYSHKILLNYPDQIFLKFNRSSKNFYTTDSAKFSNGISEIFFDLNVESINFNSNLIIYRKGFGSEEKEIIFSKFFDDIIQDKETIKINYQTKKINNIYWPTFLEFNNLYNDKIKSITLILQNEFELNNFKIIDNFEDCYYVR